MNNKSEKEKSGEQISSLVDGEFDDALDIESHIDYLVKDKEASHCWERYHLISDTLKRNLPRHIDNQLASRVMAELENEPTVLAPSRTRTLFGKRMAGLAVAASVASVAVLGVQFMYKEDVMAPSSQIAQVNSIKVPVNKEIIHRDIQTVTQAINPVAPSSQQLTQLYPAKNIKRYHPNLNKYLLSHNQRAARGVVQGVIPYARIITNADMERLAQQSDSRNTVQNQIQR